MSKAKKGYFNSFVLYTDYKEQVALLPDDEAGQLLKALLQYVETGETPKFSGMLKMCFSFIAAQIHRDKEKYIDVCEKRAEAGRKGGKQTQANKASACFDKQAEQMQTKQADNENVLDNDIAYDDDTIINNICALLNNPREIPNQKGRGKGRLKPQGYKTYVDGCGVSPRDAEKVAKELANENKILMWWEFADILNKKKTAGEI